MRTVINKLPLPDESKSERIGNTDGEFSVCQFFPDESYEYVRRWVSPEEAMQAFVHYITSVGARAGMTVRVIVTDGGDSTNMEWKFEEGIVFPVNLLGQFRRGVK